MALPVVTVAAGGLPVIDVTATAPRLGLPVTEASNGRGTAVTKVAVNGLPVTFSTVPDWPGGGSTSAEATAFLARTSGLDAPHTSAYTALIDGLVADGIWAKLDVLHVYATQNSTTAQLNLVSSSFPATLNGPPSFAVNRGYTGVDGSGSVYIATGFGANVGTPKFTQHSGHISAWSVTDVTSSHVIMGSITPSISETVIYPKFTDGNSYYRINGAGASGVANANGAGHYVAARSSSGTGVQGYKNGSSVASTSGASSPISTFGFDVLGTATVGASGSAFQVAMASIGSNLTAGEVTAFYNRLRTYMTAVGVP